MRNCSWEQDLSLSKDRLVVFLSGLNKTYKQKGKLNTSGRVGPNAEPKAGNPSKRRFKKARIDKCI